MYDKDGQGEGNWIIRDITERKEAEEMLGKYRIFSERTGYMILFVALDGRIIEANNAAVRTYGFTREELLTMDVHRLRATDPKTLVDQQMQEARAGDILFETVHKRKDGSILPVEVSLQYVEAGDSSFIVSIVRDISERKRIEAELKRSTENFWQMVEGTIGAIMSMVEVGDPYTSGHQKRVALLATAIGQRIGLPEEQVQGLHYAALIHDLGKIYVPAQILNKPGRLNDIEFNLIKMHSKVGYDILKTVDFPWPVADIVVQHHERIDGSGYPNGLIGTDILLESRILAVADVVEAMTSHRPYRQALGLDRALQEIRQGRGNLYDPKAVDACLELIREGYRFDIVADPIRKGNRRKGLQLNRWTL